MIDFVITWVDGADPAWQKKRADYHPGSREDAGTARYRDWGLLRYWFRAVEAFAPWVRRVYLVTDGQCPPWLNRARPGLVVADHRDFIPDRYLPTFSANPIELNLHRLEGLAEQFVFFNDDMYLLRPVQPEDFFRGGLPVDDALLSPVIVTHKNDIGSIALNDMCLINTHFEKRHTIRAAPFKWLCPRYGPALLRTLCLLPWRHFPGFYNDHLPQPFLKSSFEDVWQKEGEVLDEVCTHRFRDYQRDVNQWLIRYWQFAQNRFVPGSPARGKDLDILRQDVAGHILGGKSRMICINDSDKIRNFEDIRADVERAFQKLLPIRSSFEDDRENESVKEEKL